MTRKPKTRALKTSKAKASTLQTAALIKHAKAMEKHTAALIDAAAIHATMALALKNNTAILTATKAHKTFNQKTVDAGECLSQWLMAAKGISRPDSTNPAKNMASDCRIGTPQEMQLCLEAVQSCMAQKGNYYNLDTTSPNANQHLNSLLTGSLGAVVADIVANTT